MGAEEGLEEVHYVSAPGSGDGSFDALNPFWRDLVFENPAWDYRTFDLERDGALAKRKLAAVLDADDPDLTRFAARGGKLIVYHGWADPLPPPSGSIDYVERVARTIGAERADPRCNAGLIATKRKNDGDATSDVLRTRPLCAYPKVARYIGLGSTDDAVNFVCAAPR